MYRITVERITNQPGEGGHVKLFEQTIDSDELNLLPLISAINRKPRKSRAKSAQNGAGDVAKK